MLDAHTDGPIRRRLETTDPNERIRKLVVIIVNAATELPEGIENQNIAPGLLEMGRRAAAIGVTSHSETTLQLARCQFDDQEARGEGYEPYVIEVNPLHLQDPDRRRMLVNLPTTLDLRPNEVTP